MVRLSMQAQVDPKSSLSARLSSLFSSDSPTPKNHPPTNPPPSLSEPASRRRSLDESVAPWDGSSRARTRPPSPNPHHSRAASMSASALTRGSQSSKSFTIPAIPGNSLGFGRAPPLRNQPNPSLPVLRWLTSKSSTSADGASHSRASTPTQSNPPSPSAFSALDDALHDNTFFTRGRPDSLDLPSRPQAARLPAAFHSARPPEYLSSLARSALPTASVSPLSSASAYRTTYADPFDDPFTSSPEGHNSNLDVLYSPTPIPLAMPHSPPAAHLMSSPPVLSTSPRRSSIDSLRSIQEKGKGIHTSAPTAQLFPNFPNAWKGWFATDGPSDKENMDPFLDERDKAETAQGQRERLRKHCESAPTTLAMLDLRSVLDVSPKNPVVFCHGLLGFDTVKVGLSIAPVNVSHWRGIKDALEANGVEVCVLWTPNRLQFVTRCPKRFSSQEYPLLALPSTEQRSSRSA